MAGCVRVEGWARGLGSRREGLGEWVGGCKGGELLRVDGLA